MNWWKLLLAGIGALALWWREHFSRKEKKKRDILKETKDEIKDPDSSAADVHRHIDRINRL